MDYANSMEVCMMVRVLRECLIIISLTLDASQYLLEDVMNIRL